MKKLVKLLYRISIYSFFAFQATAMDQKTQMNIDVGAVLPCHSSLTYMQDFIKIFPDYTRNGKIELTFQMYEDERINPNLIEPFSWIANLLNYLTDKESNISNIPEAKYFTLSEAKMFFAPYLEIIHFPNEEIEQKLKKYFSSTKDFCSLSSCKIISSQDDKLPEPKDYFSLEELLDIDQVSRLIIKGTPNEASILFLGNSPSYYGKRVRSILSNEPNFAGSRNLIFVPFSGAANASIVRFNDSKPANISSPDGVKFLRSTFSKNGLSLDFFKTIQHKPLFIVDGRGSGACINSFLFHITNWLDTHSINYPKFTFLLLATSCGITAEDLPFAYSIQKDDLLSDKTVLSDFTYLFTGVTKSKIEAEGKARIQPHFKAYCWSEDYQSIMDSYPGPYAQELIHVIQSFKTTL